MTSAKATLGIIANTLYQLEGLPLEYVEEAAGDLLDKASMALATVADVAQEAYEAYFAEKDEDEDADEEG
jgi:hypothetical protein